MCHAMRNTTMTEIKIKRRPCGDNHLWELNQKNPKVELCIKCGHFKVEYNNRIEYADELGNVYLTRRKLPS